MVLDDASSLDDEFSSLIFTQGDDKVFRLNSDYVRKEKGERATSHWKEEGIVYLPPGRNITKVVVEVDGSLAEEIKILYLAHNPVSTIEYAEKLKGVKELRCVGDGVRFFPRGVERMPAIDMVYLSDSAVEQLPSWFMEIETLKRIEASGNHRLREINIGKNITFLNVSRCDIRYLPSDLFHHQLVEVNLSVNSGLTYLPALLPSSSLRKLRAESCSIEFLPHNLFHYKLEEVNLVGNRALTYLPTCIPASKLKSLEVENCSIEKIHESLIRPGMNINLANNQISELPREETRNFLENGGTFTYTFRKVVLQFEGPQSLNLNENPLTYPPKHTCTQGKSAVITYLKNYANLMVDPNDITMILIGNLTAGKTSLGLALAGKISSASEVKADDRTHAFDVHQTLLEGIKVQMIDKGGHEQYEVTLAIMSQDIGLHVCVINPCDLESDERLDRALWSWVEKLLDGAIAPNLLIVVSKIDQISPEEKHNKLQEMKERLKDYLATKSRELEERRKERERELKDDLDNVAHDLATGGHDANHLANLNRQKQHLEKMVSRLTYKVNHLPVFNEDCITFVSSESREGFDLLRKNMKIAIDNLPKVKVQVHWKQAIELLLTAYSDKPYVNFSNILKKSGLTEDDLIEMLKALCAMGRIVWSEFFGRKEIIFHQLVELSLMMKSIFYHEMRENIRMFAECKELASDDLEKSYEQGQIPVELIQCMFGHISNQPRGLDKKIRIDFVGLTKVIWDGELKIAMDAFLATLQRMKLLFILPNPCHGMKMCFVPHLLIQKSTDLDQEKWLATRTNTCPFFELGLLFKFDTAISKNIFAKCCVSVLSCMQDVATMMETELIFDAQEGNLVVRSGHFQIVVLRRAYYLNSQNSFLVTLKLERDDISTETVWILTNEVASKLQLDDIKCHLVCPSNKGAESCNHGDYCCDPTIHVYPQLEKVLQNPTRWARKIICASKDLSDIASTASKDVFEKFFPTQLASVLLNCLHKSTEESRSPLDSPPPPQADYLEMHNLLLVLLTKPIPDKSRLEEHPALNPKIESKILKTVVPVREYMKKFDDVRNDPTLLPKFVEYFALLEVNGTIVTNGEWTAAMGEILNEYPDEVEEEVKDESASVTAMVRTYRNIFAHRPIIPLLSKIRNKFGWIIMHSFSFLVRHVMDEEPTLLEFANAFQRYEATQCKVGLDEGSLQRSKYALLRVRIICVDAPEVETICFHDRSKSMNELETEVRKTYICLPVLRRLVYSGEYKEGPVPHWKSGTDLAAEDCLPDTLDTSLTHLVQFVEKPVRVQIEIWSTKTSSPTTPVIIEDQNPKTTIEVMRENEGMDVDLELYHGKKKVKGTDTLESFGDEDCKLVAIDFTDNKAKKKYINSFC